VSGVFTLWYGLWTITSTGGEGGGSSDIIEVKASGILYMGMVVIPSVYIATFTLLVFVSFLYSRYIIMQENMNKPSQ